MARRSYKFYRFRCAACGVEKSELHEVGKAPNTISACACGGTMERVLEGGVGRRACEEWTRIYDPRDNNVMIHNLDTYARQNGWPGYKRDPRR